MAIFGFETGDWGWVVCVFAALPLILVYFIVRRVTKKTAGPPAPKGRAPGWYPDPAQQHEQRYWDGKEWTASVQDASALSTDPLPTPGAADSDRA